MAAGGEAMMRKESPMLPRIGRLSCLGWMILMLTGVGCAQQKAVAKAPIARTAVATEAHVPLRVWLDGATEVSTTEPRDLMLRFEATMPLASLTTAMRGMDGLHVAGGEARKHGARDVSAATTHAFSLRVPAGVSGLLAIDVTWERAGESQSATLAIRVSANGAQPKVEKLGRIEQGRDGQPVQVMPAEMR